MPVSYVRTSAGTVVSIATTAPTTYDLTGFSGLTFTPIGELTDTGAFGRKANIVKHSPISTKLVVKRAGSVDIGDISLKMGLAQGTPDAGQLALSTACTDSLVRSFKVLLPDASIRYFTGIVSSYVLNVGGVDTITAIEAMVAIDNDVIVG